MKKVTALLAVTLLLLGFTAAWSCTNLMIQAQDGTLIRARSMEMVAGVSRMLSVPRGFLYQCTLPDGAKGMKWTGKYGYVGITSADIPVVSDGINEKGLTFGMLEFPKFVGYSSDRAGNLSGSMAPWEFGSFLLANFAGVDELVKAVPQIKIVGPSNDAQVMLPLHYFVADKSGRAVVIEPVAGAIKVYEDPLWVMTNAPGFDWMMINLRNYIELRAEDYAPKTLKQGVIVPQTGTGSGALGLPGDQTPSSRFVRAVFYTQNLIPPKNAQDGLQDAIAILSTFFRPNGSNYQIEHGKKVCDITDWETFTDLTNLRYYYRTYRNSDLRLVDLTELDFNSGAVKSFPLAEDPVYRDYSEKLK